MMNDIQNKSFQTPIEIALGVDENGMTTAKKLYDFLELTPGNYARWCKSNITDNEFVEEGLDYWVIPMNSENSSLMKSLTGRGNTEDYKLTAHFAKKLSCKGNGHKSEQAREYFTGIEERVKQKVIDYSNLSPELQRAYALIESQARIELEQKRQAEEQRRQAERINKIEQKQATMLETFISTEGDDDFRDWVNKCVSRIAESPKFDKGVGPNSNYAFARNESYERLKSKWKCNLDDRVSRAKGRALQRNPGISKTELDSINKLTIISADKSLRPVYETVIKEMMIAYCVDADRKSR